MRIVFFLVVVAISSCQQSSNAGANVVTEEVITTPGIKLTDMDGQPISVQQYRGKTIFINIWATWCKPCIQEMPSIKNAQALFSKQDIVFLLASSENIDDIKRFSNEHHFDFTYVRLENMEELNLDGLPTTYIFNSKGELKFSETGARKWDDSSNIILIKNINDNK